jgi:3-oxoacyl-[acyl-carrier-protein] synthase II
VKGLVVTGLGVVSPVGLGSDALAEAYADPDAATARAFDGTSTQLPAEEHPNARVAEVRGFDPTDYLGKKGHRNFDRLTYSLVVAAGFALEDAGVKNRDKEWVGSLGPKQVGVCSSTAYGSLDEITELNLVAELEDPRYMNPARFPNTVINAAAGYVSIWHDLRAPNATVVDGNCGALDAVLSCETHLRHRRADAFLVGGGDVLTKPLYLALRRMSAVAEGDAAWAPGERTSRGLHLGEGAAYVFCEREADAVARGARIRARLSGYGTTFDPPAGRLLHANAEAIALALRAALEDAGRTPDEVDLVVSYVGGLPVFDRAELTAIDEVFGPDTCVVAPKRLYGECFSGAAALALAGAVTWIGGAQVAPVLRGSAPETTRCVVVVAVGYYGNVTAVVVDAP